MKALDLVTAALADYRLATLVSKDQITAPVRDFIGIKAAGGSPSWKFIADLVNCPYCLGVWFGLFVWVLSHFNLGRVFMEIFAIAGFQDYLQSTLERNKYAEA